MTRLKQHRGFTLIELVISIAIIGISTATVSKLLVSGLNFVEIRNSRSQEILQAKALYETFLAIDEKDGGWDNQKIFSDCHSRSDDEAITAETVKGWIDATGSIDSEDIEIESIYPSSTENQRVTCEIYKDKDEDGTLFIIPVAGDRDLQLFVLAKNGGEGKPSWLPGPPPWMK